MLSWISSLFRNSTQNSLINLADYERPLSAAKLRPEILARYRDYETRETILSALNSATDESGRVVLGRVVDQFESHDFGWKHSHDKDEIEVLRDARLGAWFLIDHLVDRANKIAQSIKAGAKEALSDALP